MKHLGKILAAAAGIGALVLLAGSSKPKRAPWEPGDPEPDWEDLIGNAGDEGPQMLEKLGYSPREEIPDAAALQEMINQFQKDWNEARENREMAEAWVDNVGQKGNEALEMLMGATKNLGETGTLDEETTAALRELT